MQKMILSHSQSLHLTASLKEAISLLQLSNYELFEKVSSLSQTNPFIHFSALSHALRYKSFSLDEEKEYKDPREESLVSYLKSELLISKLAPDIQKIASNLIEHCDEKGFFDPAEFFSLPSHIQHLINLWLKKLDPIGLGSRSIYECLLWQIDEKIFQFPQLHAVRLVLEKMQQGKGFSTLSKNDLESVKQILNEYECHFYFYPASCFSSTYHRTEMSEWIDLVAIWDREKERFLVRRHKDYKWELQVESWPENLSKKHSLRKMYQEAVNLEKMIAIRNNSLQKTVQILCDYQKEFLLYGFDYLKPMILKDLHEKVGLHESTLCRLLDKKTILTKNGLILIKNMLSRPIKSLVNNAKSQKSVHQMILHYLMSENLTEPYSDDKITKMLRAQGIDIARRTVSKYREDLGFLSSHKRKKFQENSYV